MHEMNNPHLKIWVSPVGNQRFLKVATLLRNTSGIAPPVGNYVFEGAVETFFNGMQWAP